MNKKYLSIFLFLFLINNVIAQVDRNLESLKNVVPPSPNTSSLGKFGEWPVSLYTGVPNISVPIYELKGRSQSVPISLSYHASGIRVGEVASWVGLGWALGAGGCISRTIQGLPDEDGYTQTSTNYSDPNNFCSSVVVPTQTYYQNQGAAAQGNTDTQQDIYNMNVLGKSYRIYFKADGSAFTMPASNIKIIDNFQKNNNQSWTVVLEDGTKLVFGGVISGANPNVEQSFGNARFSNIGAYISAWYLQSMTSPTGETFSFTYTSNTVYQDNHFSQSDELSYLNGGTIFATSGNGTPYFRNSNTTKTTTEIQEVTQLSLNTIESDLARVYFIPSTTTRSDLNGATSLSEIKVLSKLTNAYVEDWQFNYVYTQATSGNEVPSTLSPSDVSYVNQRLRLSSLSKVPVDGTASQTWSFNYNPINLPSRRSFAQDHWGFYNGATNNISLLPKIPFNASQCVLAISAYGSNGLTNIGFIPNQSHEIGNSRSANETYMQAELLNKIIYPTGGYTVFNYEGNKRPVNQEIFRDTTVYFSATQNNILSISSFSFSVATPQYINLNISSSISQGILNDMPSAYVSIQVVDANGAVVCNIPSNGSSWFNLYNSGNYTCRVYTNASGSLGSGTLNVSAFIRCFPSSGFMNVNQFLGGLRIKNMQEFDGISSSAVKTKSYVYDSAFVLNPVDTLNDYITTQTVNDPPLPDGEQYVYQKLTRNSSTKFAMGSIQGGTVGYAKVTSYDGLDNTNGYTVSSFSSYQDNTLANSLIFPYPPYDQRDWRNGQLLNEIIYNSSGVPLKSISNTYNYVPKFTLTNSKVGYSTIGQQCLYSNVGACGIQIACYPLTCEQVQKVSSSETMYNPVNGNALTTTTSYYYDNPLNMQPIRTVTQNSKAETITNYSRTALEKSDIQSSITLTSTASQAIDSMNARNMISSVVESEKYLNGTLLNRSLVNYKMQSNGFVLPDNAMVQYGNNAIETRVQFNAYDNYGNLLEQQKINNVKEVYLWSYANTYPVAKIIGSSYSTVSGYISQSQIDANIASDASMRSVLNPLRTQIPSALIETYTYKPLVGMTSKTDPSGRTGYFEYDGFGRVSLMRYQDQNILKKYEYQYQASSTAITPPTIFSNTVQTGTYTRNNCGTGYTGSSVVYTVPAGTYTSAISQADADSKAQTDVSTNGQNNANTYGTCTSSSTPCTITMNYGYSSATSSVNNNGSTVSGYIVFYPTMSAMTAGTMYQIATIGIGCRPSGTRTFSTYAGGRKWTITVYPGGMIYAQIAYGSTALSTYSTVSINISYSL
ncbi:MAG: DUF5977 domain-containing protein [Bacteroidetes bacterium]|nr:DUF5977 domain-containing protein [Bacteroidota bacterium]